MGGGILRFKLHIHVPDALGLSLLLSQDHLLLCADGAKCFPALPIPFITRQGALYGGRCIVIILPALQVKLCGNGIKATGSDATVILNDLLERLDLGL
ncbi:hypothetical protein D3C78_738950 [compost metagenome]